MQRWPHAASYRPLGSIRRVTGRQILLLPCRRQSHRSAINLSDVDSRDADDRFDILFCGSDAFSAASLGAVLNATDVWRSFKVLVPVEKRAGRLKPGQQPEQGVLAQLATAWTLPLDRVPLEGIAVYQLPETFREPKPNSLLITASFGHILPNAFLSSFLPHNRLNVHPSLLPRWRGAAPIQWTIASGDGETGVVVQRLVEKGKGIDAGEIVGSRGGIVVPDDATYSTLLPLLADAGAEVLVDVLRAMQKGEIGGHAQDAANVTRAPKITEQTARIRWSDQTAQQLDRLSRGISHQEPQWTTLQGQKIQLLLMSPCDPAPSLVHHHAPEANESFVPGTAALDRKTRFLKIACAGAQSSTESDLTWVGVKKVRPAGKKAMDVMEWWNGLPREMRAAKYIRFDS